jgi:hypothetical protein
MTLANRGLVQHCATVELETSPAAGDRGHCTDNDASRESCADSATQSYVTVMIARSDIVEAHKRSSNHREAVSKAERCGCFYNAA